MSMERYREARAAGLTKSEAGGVAAAQDLGAMCRRLITMRQQFLSEKGLTMDQAKALPATRRRELNVEWLVWYEQHKSDE